MEPSTTPVDARRRGRGRAAALAEADAARPVTRLPTLIWMVTNPWYCANSAPLSPTRPFDTARPARTPRVTSMPTDARHLRVVAGGAHREAERRAEEAVHQEHRACRPPAASRGSVARFRALTSCRRARAARPRSAEPPRASNACVGSVRVPEERDVPAAHEEAGPASRAPSPPADPGRSRLTPSRRWTMPETAPAAIAREEPRRRGPERCQPARQQHRRRSRRRTRTTPSTVRSKVSRIRYEM